MKKKTYVVIGLGRFGSAVATELCRLGHEVLVIDGSEEHVQNIADQVTHAAAGTPGTPPCSGPWGCATTTAPSWPRRTTWAAAPW